MNHYILVSLFWVAYFFLHSLLASLQVKRFFGNPRWYRLGYNFISLLLLFLIFLYLSVTPSFYVFPKSRTTDFLGFVLAAYGVIVLQMSFKKYGIKEFIGLKDDKAEAFVTEGILSRIRHPIYAATILIVVGFVLYIPKALNLLSAFWVFAYLPIGIWLEEKKLVEKYGQQYESYRRKVPAIFPRLFS